MHAEFWLKQARKVRDAAQRASTDSQVSVSVKWNEGCEAKRVALELDQAPPADAHTKGPNSQSLLI